MKYTEEEVFQAHQNLKQTANPKGAVIGALMAVIPAIAIYAFFVEMGAILYIFILIPSLLIGIAAQITGRVYLVKHRIIVALIAVTVHFGCLYYFSYAVIFYFFVPMIFFTALSLSKRDLNRIQLIVVDMEVEGRFD